MPKGYGQARHSNIAAATIEGRRVLLQTKSWYTTKEHLKVWLKLQYAISRTTIDDYLIDISARLSRDPETKKFMETGSLVR